MSQNPELWSEVHSRLIVAIADALSPAVRPKYRVAIEKRMYLINLEEGRSRLFTRCGSHLQTTANSS